MRKPLLLLVAFVIIYSGCKKEHTINFTKQTFKVSFKPALNANLNSTWQQIIGGNALITFLALSSDTLTASSVKDSLNLTTLNSYSKPLITGVYNITLNTTSMAVIDTFIRFNAASQNVLINKDQAISLPAATTDGVITLKQSLIATGTVPTFTVDGGNAANNFGLANGYYFIYVKNAISGKITFTEATTGYQYMNELTVSALNQYDLSPIINTVGLVKIHTSFFVGLNNTAHIN